MLNTTFFGLDVHKETITIARVKGYADEIKIYVSIKYNITTLKKVLFIFDQVDNLKVCYEASSCGYTIYRHLKDVGIECNVAASSLIPRKTRKPDKN